VVLITHRTSAISVTNKLLLLHGGTAQKFGPTAQVLSELSQAAQMQTAATATAAKPVTAVGALATPVPAEPRTGT
jgi:ATP-binding cassette, subfamily C, bacterial exporter for protease/lipase